MEILKSIRFCAICSQKDTFQLEWLCKKCSHHLNKQYLDPKNVFRLDKKMKHFRLFDWHSENHEFISRLIYSLKQGGPEYIFDKLGREQFFRYNYSHLSHLSKGKKIIFIPSPSRYKIQSDHAMSCAKSLNKYFSGEIKILLRREEKENLYQKNKLKKDRARLRFILEKPLSKKELEEDVVIFVDDVLTTGFTALSSYRALGFPKNFLVFTLAYRCFEDRFKEDAIYTIFKKIKRKTKYHLINISKFFNRSIDIDNKIH